MAGSISIFVLNYFLTAVSAVSGAAVPVIQVKRVATGTFGDHKVLDDINLSIGTGKTRVILGGSGSGKTVLMKHMIGLLKPDSGQVLVDGEDIVPLTGDSLVSKYAANSAWSSNKPRSSIR